MSLFLRIIISNILIGLIYFSSWQKEEGDKTSPLERGFSCLDNPLLNFRIQFYLLLIIFILFDIEIVLMLRVIFFNFWQTKRIIIFILFVLLTLFLEYFWGKLNWFNSTFSVIKHF